MRMALSSDLRAISGHSEGQRQALPLSTSNRGCQMPSRELEQSHHSGLRKIRGLDRLRF